MADHVKNNGDSANKLYDPVSEIDHFLNVIWGYFTHEELYYEITIIDDTGVKPYFFQSLRQAIKWVQRRLNWLNGRNVYYGVLPRTRRPPEGRRGSIGDIGFGHWLWLDLDYKEYYMSIGDVPIKDEARKHAIEHGYWFMEKEDHELEAVYYDAGKNKWAHVKRPPLSTVLRDIEEKTGLKPTIVVDSGNGYHAYFKLIYDIDAKQLARLESLLVDITGADPQTRDLARILRLPGTVNPRINRPVRIILETGAEYDPEELLRQLQALKPNEETGGAHGEIRWRHLPEEKKRKIIDILKEPWEKAEGNRFSFVGALAGLFAKSHIAQEDCEDIVARLYTLINRHDMEHVRDIKYTYRDYLEGKPVCAIDCPHGATIKGLRQLFEELLGEERGQEALLRLMKLVSDKPRGSLAWLRVSSSGVKEWIDRGRSGIYIKRRVKDEVESIRISRARIKSVKRVKVIGLERLKEVFKIELDNDQVYIGVVEDLARDIRRYYGLKKGTEYALSILFEALAEEYGVEELFYSPGPWIIEDRVVIAEKPGYIAQWKRNVIWRPERDGDVGVGLAIIKRNIEAYRDPHLASTVMSYGIIAWAAHWFKSEFSIFPHMVIWGPRGRGKTYLLELLMLIYGFTWTDFPPTSDFQARRELSTSTLPYILTEGNDFFRKLLAEDRNTLAGLAVLSKAATDIELRESGGYNYGGIFLGIRAFITATNIEPEQLSTFDADKFILVRISKESGIDLAKVHGITPKAIRNDPMARKAVATVFSEALKVFEEKIPEIRERLLGKGREELVNEYISIGYEIWREIYKRHNMEPFPEPAKISLENQVETLEDRYREAFNTFLTRKIMNNDATEPDFMVDDYEALRKALLYHGAAIYRGDADILIAKTVFISQFKVWARRELGLELPGWRELADILGFKHTTWTEPKTGKRITNVLVRIFK